MGEDVGFAEGRESREGRSVSAGTRRGIVQEGTDTIWLRRSFDELAIAGEKRTSALQRAEEAVCLVLTQRACEILFARTSVQDKLVEGVEISVPKLPLR
jgi:hypothetical protein